MAVDQPYPELERTSPRGRDLVVVAVLLVLTTLPDAMVVPLLEELLVGRYEVGPGLAHLFVSINLVGGLCALPLLRMVARRGKPVVAVAFASILDAALLAAMWLPIGFTATIVLRGLEGAADVVVFAVVFDLVGHAGRHRTVGARFGLAATLLSIALGGGAILGAQIAKHDPGSGEIARMVFVLGALSCLLAGVLALLVRPTLRRLQGLSGSRTTTERLERPRAMASLWPLLAIAASDRALGGLLTGTLGLFFAEALGLGIGVRGWLIGTVLLLMGFGALPAGWISDRVGDLRLRTVGALCFAGGLLVLPAIAGLFPAMVVVLIVVGVGGATLLPTSLAMLDRLHGGLVSMGAYRASGDVGFLVGVTTAGGILMVLGGASPHPTTFAVVIAGFALMHLVVTVVTSVVLEGK